MKSHRFIALGLLSFLSLSCVKTGPARQLSFESQSVEISGFSDRQQAQIESTLVALKSLKKELLKINGRRYRRLSRFETLFGFPFDGPLLSDWVLSRIPKISYQNTWTVAINQNKGTLFIGDAFFEDLTELERLYLLIHEARHSDDDGHEHVACPEGFPFVSAAQPDQDLVGERACDKDDQGAYAYQATFLFELFAYEIFDQREVGLVYNSSISRILK